ncbi:MAG: hypothetical protein ABFC77_16485 [Thermoguttaceae bacterium]
MLPEMSGLQFLVVQLLFAGRQTGGQLRRRLGAAGAPISRPSFTRLMHRMENAGYLQAESESGPNGYREVLPRRFEVTDLGVAVWRRVREFYTACEGPPKRLTPIVTEAGELAHLPRAERRKILDERARKCVRELFQEWIDRLHGRNADD